ncbi:MAG: hypothetical protein JW825_06490 [Candidatus Methanofastidiosa archaeon]|nr:hypothetical protein [Candidatus Methanofastidiosa archaeon]
MYRTLEEIDAELEKLRKRREEAQEMIDNESYGGLIRGSAKKAAIAERESELLRHRKALESKGHHINFEERFKKLYAALQYLEAGLSKEHPEHLDKYNEIVTLIEELEKEMKRY